MKLAPSAPVSARPACRTIFITVFRSRASESACTTKVNWFFELLFPIHLLHRDSAEGADSPRRSSYLERESLSPLRNHNEGLTIKMKAPDFSFRLRCSKFEGSFP